MFSLLNWIVGSLSGIVCKKKYIPLLVTVCMSLLFIMNENNRDLTAYKLLYAEASMGFVSGLEPGYNLLCYLFSHIGFDYMTFRNVMAVGSIALLAFSAKRLSTRPALALSLYCFAQFWLDITLSRNFFSLALVVWATSWYFTRRGGDVRFVVLILAAASIHESSIVYLVFPIAKRVGYNSVLTASVVSSLVVLMLMVSTIANNVLVSLLDPEEYSHYFMSRPFLGSILCSVTSLLFIVTAQLLNNDNKIDNEKKALVKNIACANLLALPLCILYFLNSSELFRLFKCILFLDYSVMSLYINELGVDSENKQIAICILAIGIALVFFTLASSHPLDGSLVPILFESTAL
ncbi:EpsG family protein [Enorma massiliensis]|uniref:EpsG family protein n=1 Tax=Enorma massiliensis TaxID=1472761 RepID=UPI0034A4D952